MDYKNLTQQEQDFLRILAEIGQITADDLPLGIWVGLDSMGPARDSKTDALFPGMPEVLHGFTQTMAEYNLGLVVATNGPAKEAHDILAALDRSHKPRAFGAAEGGGLIVQFANGTLEDRVIAPQSEISDLERLEDAIKQDTPLMKALLEDTEPSDGGAPIRTPYKTNIVLTLPNQYATLQKRLEKKGVNIENFIPGIDVNNYINKLLDYASSIFSAKTQEFGLTGSIGPAIVKSSNKRVYVPTRNVYDEQSGSSAGLSKYSGVVIGSRLVDGSQFNLSNSLYVADNAIDSTQGEHAVVLGASERSMIKNGGKQAKMAFNITMNSDMPRMEYVEGVKILNIGSGAKALEAIDFLYKALHPTVPHQRYRAA